MSQITKDKREVFADFMENEESQGVGLYAYLLDHLLDDIRRRDKEILSSVFWGVDYMSYMETFAGAAKRYLLRFSSLLPPIKSIEMSREFAGTGIRAECWEPGDDEYYAREEPQLVISFGPLGEWTESVSLVVKQRTKHKEEVTRLLDDGLIAVRGERQNGSWAEAWIVMEDHPVTKGENKGEVWKALDELIRSASIFGFPISAHDIAEFTCKEEEEKLR
jgi:hypothetical protein